MYCLCMPAKMTLASHYAGNSVSSQQSVSGKLSLAYILRGKYGHPLRLFFKTDFL